MPQASHLPPKHRRIPRWLKVSTITLLVGANLAVLGILWVIKTGEDALATADTNSEVVDVLDSPAGSDLNFLIVGSDSREGLDSLQNFGPAGGARGDVIMLVRLDSETSTAHILSIPRDLWVDIPGHGQNRINAAYAFGGPSLMVETIKQNLGVEINHYVEIDFVGFQALVDELGGVVIDFPYPARDSNSGLSVEAGSQTLGGKMALAYARSRHYQELQDGTWVSVNANDIGRTERQRAVIGAILDKLKRPSNITEAGEIAGAVAQHMTIDSRLAESSVATLAWNFKGILGADIDGATLPTYGDTINGASVVVADEPAASALVANFKAGRPFNEAPLIVQVLNGNGKSGAATRMSETLESKGFEIGSIGDATTSDYSQTTIIIPGGSQNGEVIHNALGFGVVQVGDVDNGYDAVVIVGADAP
jgi:LCP family protein required for cell wall assembly